MRSHWKDMDLPVDDFITQQTPGLKTIYQKVWGGMQCAYHCFAPGTDFTHRRQSCWRQCRTVSVTTGLVTAEHHAYVISGSMAELGRSSTRSCWANAAGRSRTVPHHDHQRQAARRVAGDVCFWPAPHNFISEEGAEIIQFSGSGALAAQAKVDRGPDGEDEEVSADEPEPPQCAPRLSPYGRMTGRGLPGTCDAA